MYEDAIGLALGHVAVSARLKAAVVGERAALQYARDRDLGKLEATIARLDAEAEAAVNCPSRVPTASEARAYLESLPELWAKTSDAGCKAIAEAVFERIDVRGPSDYTFTLTAAAKARGWDAAFGPGVLTLESQGGRDKTSHSDKRPDSGGPEHGRRSVWSGREALPGDQRPSCDDAPGRAAGAVRVASERVTPRPSRPAQRPGLEPTHRRHPCRSRR